mmetsp:Transcript_996/g.2320  ORF Transcript_996/g.2320 Transcript_996/m.2320 type:complete len:208 (+) Transcript_996:149-772(+)
MSRLVKLQRPGPKSLRDRRVGLSVTCKRREGTERVKSTAESTSHRQSSSSGVNLSDSLSFLDNIATRKDAFHSHSNGRTRNTAPSTTTTSNEDILSYSTSGVMMSSHPDAITRRRQYERRKVARNTSVCAVSPNLKQVDNYDEYLKEVRAANAQGKEIRILDDEAYPSTNTSSKGSTQVEDAAVKNPDVIFLNVRFQRTKTFAMHAL